MLLEELFLENIEKYGLLKKKDKIILGISGGPDSVALAYNFSKLREKYKLKIVCAHLDHGLRKESRWESDFVRSLCSKLKLEFIGEKKDVGIFCRDSLEQTARDLRFDFFLKCARQKRIKKIALAHHKDDLAETVLMRIVRGTGLRGLRGILPKSHFKNMTVIRPFINLRKQEILDWLDKENISFCLDQSNKDTKFLRNKIRADLLPQLEKMNRNIVDRLYDLAVNAGLDYDFIHKFSFEQFNRIRQQGLGRPLCLNLEKLKEMHLSLFNNVLRIAIEEVRGDTRRIEQSHLNQIRDLIKKGRISASIHLPGVLVKKEKKALSIQTLIL